MPGASYTTIYTAHVLVRKLGHLSEYAILALFVFGIWAALEARWRVRWIGYTLLVASILAFLDEFHQSFTRFRVASINDCLIDIAGASIALLLLRLIMREKFSDH